MERPLTSEFSWGAISVEEAFVISSVGASGDPATPTVPHRRNREIFGLLACRMIFLIENSREFLGVFFDSAAKISHPQRHPISGRRRISWSQDQRLVIGYL